MKTVLFISCLFYLSIAYTQDLAPSNKVDFELGDGLNFSFNDGAYQFSIGGFMQPTVRYDKVKGSDAEYKLNSKRTFFMIGGKAVNEKVSFLIQNDFSQNQSLLDAWVAYHPYEWISITAGQKRTFLNNREMIYREDRLQFTERNLLSQTFSKTGREFGLFVETKFGSEFGISINAALTSGDGRNSFGEDSRDPDLGGVKFGSRIDLYPLGFFKEGNTLYTADLGRESKPKILIGGAASRNTGASDEVGEGHGEFLLFNENGNIQLPDYNQVYVDLLFKYQGFSFLGEFANASATNLEGTFINETGTAPLRPQQISEFLVLGESLSFQGGYVTANGFGIDARFETISSEFPEPEDALVNDLESYSVGLVKYFNNNNLKIQAMYQNTSFENGQDLNSIELVFQIVF